MPGLPIQGADITLDELQGQSVSVLNVVGSPPLPKATLAQPTSYDLSSINTPYVALASTVGEPPSANNQSTKVWATVGYITAIVVIFGSLFLLFHLTRKGILKAKQNWFLLILWAAVFAGGFLTGKTWASE
jgi:hypothetical protein